MEHREKLLREWILPKTIHSGCFGEDAELEDFIIDMKNSAADQFASEVIFVQLNIKHKGRSETKKYDVVIKVELQNEKFREMTNATLQFSNELLMYKNILPLLDKDNLVEEIFCKYYHGYVDPDDPAKDFIVLEDLREYGYRLAIEPVFLDYEHCSLAMRQIGKFHALSYLKKANDLSKLLSAASAIKDKWEVGKITKNRKMFYLCGKRGIQPQIDKGKSAELLSSILSEFEDPSEMFTKMVRPIEPEAVLCHGDFNRNNLLYTYDENLKPVGIKIIDLQTPRYSSPVIDLSFFLLMNTTHLLRKQHLNDLLNVYKQSVLNTACNNSIVPELDFGRVAIYGYFHCSYFLPVMMNKVEIDEILIEDPDEAARMNATRGGETATNVLVDIIKDLLEFDYIRKLT